MSPEHLLEPTGTCGMAHSIRLILSGRGGKLMGEATLMSTVRIELEEELAALLYQTDRPIQESVREMIVLELYRRGTISSGKAAELLGMPRLEFIRHASRLGIPHLDMTPDEWEAEKAVLDAWPRS